MAKVPTRPVRIPVPVYEKLCIAQNKVIKGRRFSMTRTYPSKVEIMAAALNEYIDNHFGEHKTPNSQVLNRIPDVAMDDDIEPSLGDNNETQA